MNHYELYPYPYAYQSMGERLEYVKKYISDPVKQLQDIGKSLVIVGCGWYEAVGAAFHCPNKYIVGIDGSKASIALATELKDELKLSNLDLFNHNFFDISIAGKTDGVVMTGVLHHLENPRLALAKCRSFLNEGGHFAGMVYSSTRKFLDPRVQMFRSYGWTDPTNPSHLACINAFLSALPLTDLCRQWYERYDKNDAEIIDTWMHYKYRTYSDWQLKKLFRKASFGMVKSSNDDHKRNFVAMALPQ